MTNNPRREYWLQSDAQRRGWGPFNSEEKAWKYLFGRGYTDEDVALHMSAGWYVGYINNYESAIAEMPPDFFVFVVWFCWFFNDRQKSSGKPHRRRNCCGV